VIIRQIAQGACDLVHTTQVFQKLSRQSLISQNLTLERLAAAGYFPAEPQLRQILERANLTHVITPVNWQKILPGLYQMLPRLKIGPNQVRSIYECKLSLPLRLKQGGLLRS